MSGVTDRIFRAFLSTLSLRRATATVHTWKKVNLFLSTLSLRRATDSSALMKCQVKISIHALLAESDSAPYEAPTIQAGISIHALLAESDP